MKISKSLEQGVYVLLILALEKDHQPLKSQLLSQQLQVSDSYLKKLLMRLKHHQLITATASKNGGYQLARPINQITLKDLYLALELDQNPIQLEHLAYQIFDHPDHIAQSEELFMTVMNSALNDFYHRLDSLSLDQFLENDAWQAGLIEWKNQ